MPAGNKKSYLIPYKGIQFIESGWHDIIHIDINEKHQMKKISLSIISIVLFSLSSCQLIGGIFKAGVWVGVLIVVGILALVIFLITRGSNKG